jgi:hypothetical protein
MPISSSHDAILFPDSLERDAVTTPVSEAADRAMNELVELFSNPRVRRHAHFKCCTDGPTEFDLWFESLLDEMFGAEPESEYKQWLDRLRRNGLIPWPGTLCIAGVIRNGNHSCHRRQLTSAAVQKLKVPGLGVTCNNNTRYG